MAVSNETPLVELNGVTHQFGDHTVLRDINWTIGRGEEWVILGPTGAGKTTLARIAAGYLWPNDGGTIQRNGNSQYNLSEWRRSVGWLSNDIHDRIPEKQSVLETVLAGCLGQTRLAERRDLTLNDNDRREATELLEEMKLADKQQQTFADLSQGETSLVLVARALISEPKLLVFDEPCSGMDPGAREGFLSVLDHTLEQQPSTSVIYITHHIEEILPVFSQILSIRDGHVLKKDTPENVITESHLSELYGVGFKITRRNQRYWSIKK